MQTPNSSVDDSKVFGVPQEQWFEYLLEHCQACYQLFSAQPEGPNELLKGPTNFHHFDDAWIPSSFRSSRPSTKIHCLRNNQHEPTMFDNKHRVGATLNILRSPGHKSQWVFRQVVTRELVHPGGSSSRYQLQRNTVEMPMDLVVLPNHVQKSTTVLLHLTDCPTTFTNQPSWHGRTTWWTVAITRTTSPTTPNLPSRCPQQS